MRLICLSFLFLLFSSTLLSAAEVNREQCASTINMYCTLCHTTERICKGLAINDSDAWETILKKMSENDEDIDAGVRTVVHSCLTSLPSVTTIVCTH
ncbi:MAG TPA: hypothetical protein ENK84_02665 [Desulfobulbus sp.]|nr:hypothetical protein [Desulfobulbus sp.]